MSFNRNYNPNVWATNMPNMFDQGQQNQPPQNNLPFNPFFNSPNAMNNFGNNNGMNNNFGGPYQPQFHNNNMDPRRFNNGPNNDFGGNRKHQKRNQFSDHHNNNISNKSWKKNNQRKDGGRDQEHELANFANPENPNTSRNQSLFLDKEGNFKTISKPPDSKFNEPDKFTPKADVEHLSESPKATEGSYTNSSLSESTQKNPKLEAICNKSATEVTQKLFSQLKTMDKSNIKDLINNPKIKYETALKQHARIKLRAQMHKQMKALISDENLEGKDQFQLEADVAIDSDKMPNEIMDEIGRKLEMNMYEDSAQNMDLCDGDSAGEDRAFEVVSKNLDGSKDLFLSAEMLLMGANSLFEYPEETKEGDDSIMGYQDGINENVDENPNLVIIKPVEPKPLPPPDSVLPPLPPLPVDSPEHDKVVELPTKTAEAKRTITNSMEMEFFLNHKNHPPPMSAEKAVIVPVIVPQVLKPSTPSFLEKPAVIERSPMIDIPSTPKRDELLPPRTPLSESGSHISVTPITSGIPVMVTTPATNYQLISGHLDENDWESSSHQDDLQSMSVHNMQQMQIIPPQIMQNPPFTITAPYNANTELTNISGPRDRPMTYRDFKNAKALRRDNVSSFDDQLADRDGEKNRFGNNNNNNNNYRPGPAGRNDRDRVNNYDKERRNDQPKFNRFGPKEKSPPRKNDNRGLERDRFGNYVRPAEKNKEEDDRSLERSVHINYAPDKLSKGGLEAILKPQGFQFKGSFKKGAQQPVRKDAQRRSRSHSKSPSHKYRSRSRDRSFNKRSKSRSRSNSTTRNSVRSASNTGDHIEPLTSAKTGNSVEDVRPNVATLKKMSDIDIEISKLIERMHGIDKVINNLQSERSIIQKSFSKIQHDRKILLDSLMKNVPSVPIISANTANSVSTPSVAPTILLTESEKIRKRKNETILKLQEQAKRKKGIHDDEPKAHKNKATTAEYKEKDDDQSTSKIQEMRNLAKGIKQATKIISPIQQLIRSEEKKKVKKHRLEHSETKSDDINHSKESDYKEEHKTKDTKSAISSGEPNSKHTSKPKKNFDSMMDAIDKTESTKKHKNSHKSHKPSKIFKLDEDQVKRAVQFARRESLFYESDCISNSTSEVRDCSVRLRNTSVSADILDRYTVYGFVSVDIEIFEKRKEIVLSKGLKNAKHKKNEMAQKALENKIIDKVEKVDKAAKEEEHSRPPTPDLQIMDSTAEVDPLAIDSSYIAATTPLDPLSSSNNLSDISNMYDYTEWNGNFIEHEMPIVHLKVVKDKYVLCASEDGKIFKYLLETSELEDVFTQHNEICNFFIYDDTEFVYSASSDGFMHKFRLKSFQSVVHTENINEPLQILDLAWDRLFIAAKSGNIFKYRTKKQLLTSTPLCNVEAPILCIKAAKEGARRILLIASRLNPVQVRDADTGLLLRSFFGDSTVMTYNIYDMIIDGHTLHCGTSKNEIYSLDFTSGDLKETRKCGSAAICLKLYENFLVAACYDGFLYVYDKNSSRLIQKFQGPGNMLLSMDTYKNRIIASTKDNKTLKMKIMPT